MVTKDKRIILDNYYADPKHIEAVYNEGLYKQIPNGRVKNVYDKNNGFCKDLMEWAYNNVFQPTAEYDTKKGIKVPFLDGSHANAVCNLGSMKSIWKQFENEYALFDVDPRDLDLNNIELQFWNHYIILNYKKFLKSVALFEDYVRARRKLMDAESLRVEKKYYPLFSDERNWISGCYDYLKHLVFTTPRGYIAELILLTLIRIKTGCSIKESSIADERKGVDGYMVFQDKTIPISLKPESYKKDKYLSPLDETCFVVYSRNKDDLIFSFVSGFDKINI